MGVGGSRNFVSLVLTVLGPLEFRAGGDFGRGVFWDGVALGKGFRVVPGWQGLDSFWVHRCFGFESDFHNLECFLYPLYITCT